MVARLALLHAPRPATRTGSSPTVVEALRRFMPAYRKGRSLPEQKHLVLWRLLHCRTARLGGYRHTCADCGHSVLLYESCHDRHCSQCNGPRRARWARATQKLLLPVPHFMVTFTLPEELREIASLFPAEVYDLLLKVSADTLQSLAKEERDPAMLSILSVLHSWSRTGIHHPHVHCLVAAGGMRPDGTWKDRSTRFLFPIKKMKRRFRGRFLTVLTKLGLPLTRAQGRRLRDARSRAADRDWVVRVDLPDERDPAQAVRYLARYVYQGPISDHRIVAMDEDTVTIRTRGAATCTMSGVEFVRRFQLHILPTGFRRIRLYGLLAPRKRRDLAVPEPSSRVAHPQSRANRRTRTRTRMQWSWRSCSPRW